jgi:hypothetical protein
MDFFLRFFSLSRYKEMRMNAMTRQTGRRMTTQSWRVRRSSSGALSAAIGATGATDVVALAVAVAVWLAEADRVVGHGELVACVGSVAEGVDGMVEEGKTVVVGEGGVVGVGSGVGVGSVVAVFICATASRGSTKNSIFLTHFMCWKESSILYDLKIRTLLDGRITCHTGETCSGPRHLWIK